MFLSTLLVLSVSALQMSLDTWYSEYIGSLYDEKKMLCKSIFHDLQDFDTQNAEVFSGREVLSLNFSLIMQEMVKFVTETHAAERSS